MKSKYLAYIGCIAGFVGVCAPAYAGEPIPGYSCRMLNITEAQSMDPSFHVPVRSSPASSAPQVATAGSVVIVRDPATPVHGFIQMMMANGRTAWVDARALKVYHSAAEPTATCQPQFLANGLVGFGPG